MSISKHLNEKNLHHAYLIEGAKDEIVTEIKIFCEKLKIKTTGNPDFIHISIDNFKIDEAFDLRAMSSSKSFSSSKKIFIICANTISLDAQNVLLKMFEEPTENTHFFLVVPDSNALLKTLISRFYIIKTKHSNNDEEEAEKFIAMPLKNRLDFIKKLLTKENDEGENINEVVVFDSTRFKALKFLNTIEFVLHKKLAQRDATNTNYFNHFLKVREFLRMPGSSTKSLMESVAIIAPIN
jgi:DNA polymerase III delta prime subunit